MKLYDAHNHLHDPRLAGVTAPVCAGAVINGTREGDWPEVDACCARFPWARRSFGLHPWHLAQRGPHWLAHLEEWLRRCPDAAVGEIGLDRWVAGHHLPTQRESFALQWALAGRLARPVTVHCLRAWGALHDFLRSQPRLQRPFLLHAWSGPPEMAAGFAELGAYFSFSPYFLRERKAAVREAFRHLPADRLLVETDAPNMAPPPERARFHLIDPQTGRALNHPGHLALAYEALAAVRGWPAAELAGVVEANFFRLFGK